MIFRGRRSYIAVVFFIVSVCLINVRLSAIQYETGVVLPATGRIDERPFFSTRRHPAIEYSDRASTDVVGEFVRKVDSGDITLRFEGAGGYLNSILAALHLPIESQSVVFSKTSLQGHYISPSNPRAIYFTDDISVAFIRGAPLLEIAALDPHQGVIFYALSNRKVDKPEIVRSDSCTSCHEAHDTKDVPGLLARSIAAGTGGEDLRDFGNFVSDHRSPMEERWGGWFITGKTGTTRHMGNQMLPGDGSSAKAINPSQPLESLDGKFDADGYPGRFSDIGALMVLDHQVGMINLMTRVGWETRVAFDEMAKNPKEKQSAERVIAADAAELADYMLFVDEAPFEGKFESTSGFQAKFAATGPHDSKGRSLRDLDLVKRTMKYPCSYMIYSPAFDGLPTAARDAVYSRLWDVLSGKDKAKKYSKLSAADKTAIVGILLETKKGLPTYFRPL